MDLQEGIMNEVTSKNEINIDNTIIENEDSLDLPQYIDHPEYVTNISVNYVLQAGGWLLFMILLFPLITLLLWWFGIINIYSYVWEDKSEIAHLNIIGIATIILNLAGLLLVWASYNWIRFHNKERRNPSENIPIDKFAQQFSCNKEDITQLRQASNITLDYDDIGKLKRVTLVRSKK